MSDATRVTCFHITGEFVTRHARERVQDQGWDDALNFLTAGLEGMDLDAAVLVLKGDKRLVGDEHGVDLEDELPEVKEEWLKQQQFLWAGKDKASSNPERHAEEAGWITVGEARALGGGPRVHLLPGHVPTVFQKKVVLDWCLYHGFNTKDVDFLDQAFDAYS